MTSERTHSRARRRIVFGLGILIAFAAGALWRGAVHEPDPDPDAPDAAESGATAERLYYCSMHPQVRSPDPNDKCPICFMDLIPVPEDDEAEADDPDIPRLRLSERAVALMEIQTWPVERRAVDVEIPLFGQIDVDSKRISVVAARADGYIERLFVNTPWQPVAVGDPLAEVYSPTVRAAMREWLVSDSGTEETGGGVRRAAARERLIRMGVPERKLAEMAQNGEVPRTFFVESPEAGALLEITAREGEFLREGDPIARLADLSEVWVNLEAYERDLPWLSVGVPVSFTVASWPGQTFEGEVTFIEPAVHPRSRTVRLRIEVDNPEGRLKPGMYVSATARARYRSDGDASEPDPHGPDLPWVVPASAPLVTGRRALVYVRVPDTDRPTFEPRRVTLGPRTDEFYIVKDGLSEGELVVVHGAFKIDSELQIRGRPGMMTPAKTETEDRPAKREETPQTHCPVMGGAIRTEYYVDVEGYRIYVCCPGCDDAILQDPERYIEQMKAEGITPYRLQTHCPVMDLPIQRDFYHDHEGNRIYVCCPGCLDEVREKADEIIEEHRSRGIVFERVGDES